jgi:hypothetical protein
MVARNEAFSQITVLLGFTAEFALDKIFVVARTTQMKNPHGCPEAVGDMVSVSGWLQRVEQLSVTDQMTHENKLQSE